ncbi:MAG: MotA/TolQ/ExbB proton channel family protein [Gammaproteobacteria bacterium]|mgnify:CR=1 FL=1|nr:MotA/TolQ/ExbB proton channel family protein [Gammaproteobacteria bacterium]
MPAWFISMGPLGWPLALCSLLALALVFERLSVFLQLQPISQKTLTDSAAVCLTCTQQPCHKRPKGWRYGLALLERHASLAAAQREEVLGCWLQEERCRLNRHLRVLQMVGVLAPMLGLLGTVLGMVTMFAGIAEQNSPVTPALLADGLWQALYTTVWGLVIAIPALAAGQGFSFWAERYLERVQILLNRCHLAFNGLDLGLLDSAPEQANLQWEAA